MDYQEQLADYLDGLVPQRPLPVQEMETYAAERGFPIIGPASGQLCYLLARAVGARRVFELGSGYGYSTYWFARAVQENGGGVVYHTVWDEGLSKMAQDYLARLSLNDVVQYRVSEAVQALRETDGPFDLIFSDINKEAYPTSLDVIAQKLRPGGILIVDNMLWSGRIFDESDTSSATTAIRVFTEQITNRAAWISSLVPIRDGLMVAYRR